MNELGTSTTPSGSGPPSENRALELVIVLLLILVAIAGAVKRAVPSKPVASTIRLGAPQFAPLSEPDAADAARLLGTSIAQLMTEGEEKTP